MFVDIFCKALHWEALASIPAQEKLMKGDLIQADIGECPTVVVKDIDDIDIDDAPEDCIFD